MRLEKKSPCKVNLILNILGKRPDGFHELETVMQPVNLYDELTFERGGQGIQLTCDEPTLPVDSKNLVYRAAEAFLKANQLDAGVRIHLAKRIPLAAGLGGGSGNAATALLGLNELFGSPMPVKALEGIAATLGSDIPFFLYDQPALATGRGEKVEIVGNFPVLRGKAFFLIHPGFGISTPWSYQNLARFPEALNGRPGRAQRLITLLQAGDLPAAGAEIYNSLEAPAFDKFPILGMYKDFLREQGALVSLMSGSGSTTFAIMENLAAAQAVAKKFRARFGENNWIATVGI